MGLSCNYIDYFPNNASLKQKYQLLLSLRGKSFYGIFNKESPQLAAVAKIWQVFTLEQGKYQCLHLYSVIPSNLVPFSGSIPKHITPLFRYQFLSFSLKAQATPASYSIFPEKGTMLTIYVYKYQLLKNHLSNCSPALLSFLQITVNQELPQGNLCLEYICSLSIGFYLLASSFKNYGPLIAHVTFFNNFKL